MPYEAKTDWKYDDLVTEKDMNRIEQGLKDAHVPAHQPLTLNPGLQVVEVENDTPFRMGEVKGRTLVNLLGRAGACDDLNAWFQHKEAGSPVFSIENSTIKIVTDIERTSARIARFFPEGSLKTGKFYIAIAKIKCTEVGECGLYLADSLVDRNKTKDWETLYSTLSVSSEMDGYLVVGGTVKANVTTHIDDVRLYEISESEYNAIGSMTPEQVAERYPYVDSITNVTNPYAIVTGGNLLPAFTEWVKEVSGVTINNPYAATITSSDDTQKYLSIDVPVFEGREYLMSGSNVRVVSLEPEIKVLSFILGDTVQEKVFMVPLGVNKVRVVVSNVVSVNGDEISFGAGTFIAKNPMLVPGTEPKPFTPQQRSMLAFETKLAAHPVDGSNPDTLFMGDDGLPNVLEQWGKVTLDGNMTYRFADKGTGFKTFFTQALPPTVKDSAFVVKYDGKMLDRKLQGQMLTDGDMQVLTDNADPNANILVLSVFNTDSGWGPDYNPTQEEIKAYFLGWRMCQVETAGLYNGTGTRCWGRVTDPRNVIGVGGWDATTTLPTSPAGIDALGNIYTPYRLQYLKAKPTVEPVRNYELGATLSAGSNMVEVGSGIVIRERANPAQGGNGDWGINIITLPASLLNHKAATINQVYKRGVDHQWVIVTRTDGSAYGNQRASISNDDFDPTAVYHVTYTMLDPTLPAPISGTVAANLRGTVSDLVRAVSLLESEISVSGEVAMTAADVGAAAKDEFDDLKKKAVVKNRDSVIEGMLSMSKNDGPHLQLVGATSAFGEWYVNNERKGWVGVGNRNEPSTVRLTSEVGPLVMQSVKDEVHIHGMKGVFLEGRRVVAELDLVKQSVVDGKGQVAAAINGKGGGPVSANNTFPELAAGVRNISTGGIVQFTGSKEVKFDWGEVGEGSFDLFTAPAKARTLVMYHSTGSDLTIYNNTSASGSYARLGIRNASAQTFVIIAGDTKNSEDYYKHCVEVQLNLNKSTRRVCYTYGYRTAESTRFAGSYTVIPNTFNLEQDLTFFVATKKGPDSNNSGWVKVSAKDVSLIYV